MKKFLFAALVAVSMSTSAFAESPAKIYSVSESKFKSDFKNATNVSWSSTAEYAKATFVSDNVRREAFYDRSGELIGTSKGITADQLPVDAKRNFVKKFGSYDVKEAIYFEGVDEAAYYISAENEQEKVVVKINDNGSLSVMKRSQK